MRRTGNKKVQDACEKIPEADREGRRGNEELVAYLVEHNPELSVMQRIIAAIKSLANDFLGLDLKLNEKDVVYLAYAAVRREIDKGLPPRDSLGRFTVADESGDVIEGKHGIRRQNTAGDMGVDGASSSPEESRLSGSLQPAAGGGDLAFSDPLSWRRSKAATPRAARLADFVSDKFKLWFGKSQLKYADTKRPIPFFHGSKTFGIIDPITGPAES